jgi:hypothetical protein
VGVAGLWLDTALSDGATGSRAWLRLQDGADFVLVGGAVCGALCELRTSVQVFDATAGTDLLAQDLTVEVRAVPEPALAWLVAAPLAGLAWRARRAGALSPPSEGSAQPAVG